MADPWGPISPNDWQNTPRVIGRPATEADVAPGFAVFYTQGDSAAASMRLPCYTIQSLEDGSKQPVVVIQAEFTNQDAVLGIRLLAGGNGICTIAEVQLLPAGFESQDGA